MRSESAKPSPRVLNSEAVGRTIRDLRLRRNLSQVKLAKALNVDVKTVSRIENGEFLPSLETIVALSVVFQMPLDEILGRSAFAISADSPGKTLPLPKTLEERVAELERLMAARTIDLHQTAEKVATVERLLRQAGDEPSSLQKTS
jgi:transcriptional regulator with XRE-family HTH domain